MAEQPAPNEPRTDPNLPAKGWRSYFDRKQTVTIVIAALFGAALTQTTRFVNWVWSTATENQENSLIEKVRRDETLASNIIEKIRKDDTLANNIKTKVIDSAEFKSVKSDVEGIKTEITDIKVSVGRIEGSLKIARAKALGIPNPNIQRISLVRQEKFTSVAELPNNKNIVFRFTILEVTRDSFTIRVDGRDARGNTYEDIRITMQAIPARVYSLQRYISGLPPLLFVIIDRPEPKMLDVAIGLAEEARKG